MTEVEAKRLVDWLLGCNQRLREGEAGDERKNTREFVEAYNALVARLVGVDSTAPSKAEREDVAFKLARIAHWSLDRSGGYTKKDVAREIGYVARALSPELAAKTLGHAEPLSALITEGNL